MSAASLANGSRRELGRNFGKSPGPGDNPLLYQVNTRPWLTALSRELGRPATLDDVPDTDLDRLARAGFDLVYFLGVWQTGAAGQAVSRSDPEWREEFSRVLPDLEEDDICGSCFAVTGYAVAEALGGDGALERLRTRLHRRGLGLILDFIPNHTAPDHPWALERPEFYVHGTQEDLVREPQNYRRVRPPADPQIASGSEQTSVVLAYGRDPYFDGWQDTLQLNYGNPSLQKAMLSELGRVADRCDGVRCDMAMLVLPEVFERTWGIASQPFWPDAIAKTKATHPGFLLMAEVYWDLEWKLQQQGFDFTYDKRLYDRLVEGDVRQIRDHLGADMDFQEHSARFLENHDEPRAASTFPLQKHRAAAVVTFLCPGLRFFHQGQLQGAKLRLPVHLCRRPLEPVDEGLASFYDVLLDCLANPGVRRGMWTLLDCRPAWDGNWTHDSFVAQGWRGDQGERLVVVVNYSDHQSQCYVSLPFSDLAGSTWLLRDLMSTTVYKRSGDGLTAAGLYLDMPAWDYHVFELAPGP
jgi:Alpha amylase, catalytic domain